MGGSNSRPQPAASAARKGLVRKAPQAQRTTTGPSTQEDEQIGTDSPVKQIQPPPAQVLAKRKQQNAGLFSACSCSENLCCTDGGNDAEMVVGGRPRGMSDLVGMPSSSSHDAGMTSFFSELLSFEENRPTVTSRGQSELPSVEHIHAISSKPPPMPRSTVTLDNYNDYSSAKVLATPREYSQRNYPAMMTHLLGMGMGGGAEAEPSTPLNMSMRGGRGAAAQQTVIMGGDMMLTAPEYNLNVEPLQFPMLDALHQSWSTPQGQGNPSPARVYGGPGSYNHNQFGLPTPTDGGVMSVLDADEGRTPTPRLPEEQMARPRSTRQRIAEARMDAAGRAVVEPPVQMQAPGGIPPASTYPYPAPRGSYASAFRVLP
mmetsp:Transcript_2168/g.5061  ORF Transcript_2168/g.5061 Transcript_2168/m.5061 type:complete len:373 (-) Transcript_2168:718-1836(-)